MGPLGVPELIVIFIVALIVFGPRKLPELGRSLGKSLAEFKRASNDLRNTLDDEIRLDERRTTTQTAASAPAVSAPAELPAPAPSQTILGGDAASETVARGQQGS